MPASAIRAHWIQIPFVPPQTLAFYAGLPPAPCGAALPAEGHPIWRVLHLLFPGLHPRVDLLAHHRLNWFRIFAVCPDTSASDRKRLLPASGQGGNRVRWSGGQKRMHFWHSQLYPRDS
jgi:hypothetical protein